MINDEMVNRMLAEEHVRYMNGVAPKGARERELRRVFVLFGELEEGAGLTEQDAEDFLSLRASIELRGDREEEYGQLTAIASFGKDKADVLTCALLLYVREMRQTNMELIKRCVECGTPFYSKGNRVKCTPAHRRCFNASESFAGSVATWEPLLKKREKEG